MEPPPDSGLHFDSQGNGNEWTSDIAEILSRLHQVRHQNSLLLEENRKLQGQLDSTEENLQTQQAELSEWEKRNRNFQNVAKENKELQGEMEDMRQRQELLERAKKELQLAQIKAERDVQYWQERAEEYAKMHSRLQQELDKQHSLMDEMKKSLISYKTSIEECHRMNRSQQVLLDNKDKTVSKLNEAVERLQEKNEALIREKEERQSELQKVKKEIRNIRFSWSEDRRMRSADLDGSMASPELLCSTPYRSESLQTELAEGMSLETSMQLPSPFCEKPVLHERLFEFSSSTSPGMDGIDGSSSLRVMTREKLHNLESTFREYLDGIPGSAAVKTKCLSVFQNVINGYQRMCNALRNEVHETREERNFLQSRYQEALQQLRDTSCLLETDIVEKMSCLEEQIKLEQLQRLEMEAQLERYKEEEEERLMKKIDASTQIRREFTAFSEESPSSLPTLHGSDQRSAWSPLLKALDLAMLATDPSATSDSVSTMKMRSHNVSRSADFLFPMLPDFDVEFSFSFDDDQHRLSSSREKAVPNKTFERLGSTGQDSLSNVPEDLRTHSAQWKENESPTLSSQLSWHDDSPLMDPVKESDEERDQRSSSSSASSVEDLTHDEKSEKSPSPQVPQPTFNTESSAVPLEEVQRLMEANAAVSRDNSNHEVPDGVVGKIPMQKNDTEDSVFEEEQTTPRVAPKTFSPPSRQAPPAPTNPSSVVFPSLPNAKLKDLDLHAEDVLQKRNWTEEEAESKFTQLSLAFRTDRQTLPERINLHIAARDTSERNVKTEIDTIRQIAGDLVQVPNFPMDVVSNIHYTCNILEQSVYRLSSRSEILGAVQQEGRLSHAVDVMVHHMDNLRVLHEKESRELDEARRILKDSRFVSTASDHGADNLMTKRSFSTAGLQNSSPVKSLRRTSASSRKSTLSSDSHDPRSRFQAAAINTVIQSSVTQHLHRLSIDRMNTQETAALTAAERKDSRDHNDGNEANGHAGVGGSLSLSEKDIIFQKGLEQGLRTQIGRELSSLREEQGVLTDSLDYLMDVRSLVPSDEEDGDLAAHKDILDIIITKGLEIMPSLREKFSFTRARWFAGGVALFLACLILLWGVLWSVHMRHPTSPPS